jgi:hypothetical protein
MKQVSTVIFVIVFVVGWFWDQSIVFRIVAHAGVDRQEIFFRHFFVVLTGLVGIVISISKRSWSTFAKSKIVNRAGRNDSVKIALLAYAILFALGTYGIIRSSILKDKMTLFGLL